MAHSSFPSERFRLFSGRILFLRTQMRGRSVFFFSSGQAENILREAGTLPMDNVRGGHADIFVYNERAYIVYFNHPFQDTRSVIHLKELTIKDGKLICDRNAPADVCWL